MESLQEKAGNRQTFSVETRAKKRRVCGQAVFAGRKCVWGKSETTVRGFGVVASVASAFSALQAPLDLHLAQSPALVQELSQ